MMAMSIGGHGRAKAEINMTPMIDVLLVLIIIFMVITPVKTRGLPAAIPQPAAAGQPAEPSSDIVVTVRDDGTTALNYEPLSLDRLRSRLEDLCRNRRPHGLFVRGGRSVEFGRVAEAIDLARGAGWHHVGLMAD